MDSSLRLGRLFSQSIQSAPKSSDGWGERSLAQAIELVAQKVSHPQQMRSGFLGWMGNFFTVIGGYQQSTLALVRTFESEVPDAGACKVFSKSGMSLSEGDLRG